MSWTIVAFCAVASFILFLAMVRNANRVNPNSSSLCDLYLLRHMLPDGHPLEFMYHGLPRNRVHPRLLWPCVTTFANAGVVMVAIVVLAVLKANGMMRSQTDETVFSLSVLGSFFGSTMILTGIPAFQNNHCFREMEKNAEKQPTYILQIKKEIEEKWPGFYETNEW